MALVVSAFACMASLSAVVALVAATSYDGPGREPKGTDALFLGPGSTGKSHLAQAIGLKAGPEAGAPKPPRPAVEALHVGVLNGLARANVHRLDLLPYCPSQVRAAGKLRPVVAANALRRASLFSLNVSHRKIAIERSIAVR